MTAIHVYVVLLTDRHVGPEVALFATKREAIAYASQLVTECARRQEDIEPSMPLDALYRAGWLYSRAYSCEGDSVTVFMRPLELP